MKRRAATFLLATAATAAAPLASLITATAAHAQNKPPQPTRLIVPFPPGGGTDILSRLIAQKLTETGQWQIVPDNKAGAGGTLGISEAAKTRPGNRVLVMGQKDNLATAPWLYKNLPWHPVKNFSPAAHIAWTPALISTRSESPHKTLADLVRAAKAAPDTLTYGSPGNGTAIHLAADQFSKAAGIQLRHVPYKGSNPALMDALAGNVDLLVSSVPSALAQIKAGKLRPLAVTSARRSTTLPDVPTVAESGFAGFDLSTWYGLLMPAGAPAAEVDKLNKAVNQLLATPEVQAAIHAQGAEPLAMSAQDFAALLKRDYESMEKIVRDAGVKLD